MPILNHRTENGTMESFLQEKIESLRFEMNDRACKHGSLTDERVVYVSQQLDRYIFVYQKLQRKRDKRK
ncbi:aspartyl-phosphate phosphatase Spo0E family protein [Paenibacillus sp. BC26]